MLVKIAVYNLIDIVINLFFKLNCVFFWSCGNGNKTFKKLIQIFEKKIIIVKIS